MHSPRLSENISMARSYNLAQRLFIDDDGKLCKITKLIDGDGEFTTDIEAARMAVVKLAKGKWLTVPVNEESDRHWSETV